MENRLSDRHYSEAERVAIEEATGERYELVDGVLYAMSGGTQMHNMTTQNFFNILQYIFDKCHIYVHNCAIKTKRNNTRYPDVSVFCKNKDGYKLQDKKATVMPDLVVEVLSPSNKKNEKDDQYYLTKVKEYTKAGIQHIYIADTDDEKVTYYSGDAFEIIGETMTIGGYSFSTELLFDSMIGIRDLPELVIKEK